MIAAVGLGCEREDVRSGQNSTWTVERDPALPTYKVVAYGDSIFSGYVPQQFDLGDVFELCGEHETAAGKKIFGKTPIARRAAPYVAGEYLSQKWNANIKVVRRTRANATALEILEDKIVAEREFMQSPDTRVVMFEMCGSNYLTARRHLREQDSSTACNYDELDRALAWCSTRMEQAMQYINANAHPNVKAKVIMNLYYPNYNANNSLTSCTDPQTGMRVNMQDKFLPYLARSNWRACHLAEQYGFECADAFAGMMAADQDQGQDNDSVVDSEALRYISGESEEDYVHRITVTLRATLRDASDHVDDQGISRDYMHDNDNIHPTFYGNTVNPDCDNFFSGTRMPEFGDLELEDGKNPEWNKKGHERLGWEISKLLPASP
ncbi:SGNH/GDSL hydrolase family protein [Archangium violaceum]|nr:SGNH/GDSL hydrolase family protein [Archangium violaceum]